MTTVTQPVTITEKAIRKIKEIMQAKSVPEDHGLRVGIKSGGCGPGGFSFMLGFDTPNDNDQVFEQNNIRIFMDKKHGIYIAGMRIDYQDNEEGEEGFVFVDPTKE